MQVKVSTGELMLRAIAYHSSKTNSINQNLPINTWVDEVYRIGSAMFGVKPNGNKKLATVELRRMINYLCCKRFHGLTQNHGVITLYKIGFELARVECREKPYDHATVINANKVHLQSIKYPERGYQGYVNMYNQFVEALLFKGLITNTELNEKNGYAYSRV